MRERASQPHLTKKQFELTTQCEEDFCYFIAQHTGIHIQDYQLKGLSDIIQHACERFNYFTAEQYLLFMQQSKQQSSELEYLIANITIGESYFFRDANQMQYLEEQVLPQLIKRKRREGNLMLHIWSAGCSQGQEIYTLAIMLHRLLPDIEKWTLNLMGTDINAEVLKVAMQGKYTRWSLRATTDEVVKEYFSVEGDNYTLSPAITQRVNFSYLNLVDDSFPSVVSKTCALDLILCRNVFIYLSAELRYQVMKKFSRCLNESGMLFLGVSEWTQYLPDGLVQQGSGSEFFYRRNACRMPSIFEADTLKVGAVVEINTESIAMNQAEYEVDKTGNKEAQSMDVQSEASPKENIIKFLQQQQWAQALELINSVLNKKNGSEQLLYHKATALANLGELEDAVSLCQQCLEVNPENKHAYLIMAQAMMEMDDMDKAEASLRKAIYLDRHFLEAHYQLSIVHMRNNKITRGLKSMKTALKLAQQGEPEQVIHNSAGITFERFAQIIESEIEIYG